MRRSQILRELRVKLVEDGQTDFAHMSVIEALKKEDNTLGKPKADRAKWAEGLAIEDALEEKVDVFLHAGCQLAYDEELWPVIREVAAMLQGAGVDFWVATKEEVCCGGASV